MKKITGHSPSITNIQAQQHQNNLGSGQGTNNAGLQQPGNQGGAPRKSESGTITRDNPIKAHSYNDYVAPAVVE